MTTERREFTLRGYLETIRRQRLLIIGVAIVCALIGLGISVLQKGTYTATSSLAVSDPSQPLALAGSTYPTTQTQLQLASIAAPQVTRPEVLNGVKHELKRKWTSSQLSSAVTVAIDPNSYALQITAKSDKATTAAAVANAFATVDARLTTREVRAQYNGDAAAVGRQLRGTRGSEQGLATAATQARLKNLSAVATPLTVASQASVPSSPSSPKTVRNVVAGLLIGLLLGIAIGTGRDVLDRRLRHSSDVTQIIDHPAVGYIRAQALGHAGPAAAPPSNGLGPLDSADEESFRILRHNVRYLAAATDTSTVLVTSAIAEEGKSTVAAGLAVATAESGKRTLLVECDLRKPVLAKRFGIKAAPGLSDYLTGNAEPNEILQPMWSLAARRNGSRNGSGAEDPKLVCITAGRDVPRPAELLASERFQSFLGELGQEYDTVILDSAPLLPVADTLGIVPHASALLLCVRLARTTRDQVRAAQSALSRLPERPVGLVLTSVGRGEDGCYHDGSYYGARKPAAV